MTVSTTQVHDYSLSTLARLAFRTAALIGPYQDIDQVQQGWAGELLDLIVNQMQIKGLFAKTIDFETVTLVTNSFQYTMAADVLDVTGPAMFIDASQTDLTQATAETPVTPMTRDEWQTLSSKDAEGPPTRYYVHRVSTPPVIYLWPVPSSRESGAHIRFQKHRLRKTSSDLSKTGDFEQYWQKYFVYALAHELALASAMPMDRVTYLAVQTKNLLDECVGYSKQRPPQQLVFSHPTRWRTP